jgi:hypothetical protein
LDQVDNGDRVFHSGTYRLTLEMKHGGRLIRDCRAHYEVHGVDEATSSA